MKETCSILTLSVLLLLISYYTVFQLLILLYEVLASCHVPITLHYITLHYITLHDITLHYITLHYITLHYITLHYITSHYITLHHITSHYITLHHITSHYITLHHITSHYITLHHITSHHIASHRIASHRIASHHITLHYITLHVPLLPPSENIDSINYVLHQDDIMLLFSRIILDPVFMSAMLLRANLWNLQWRWAHKFRVNPIYTWQ